MKNRLLRVRSVSIASVAALVVSLAGGTAFAANDPGVAQPGVGPAIVPGATSFRLAGADRYDTAIAISQKWFNTDANPRTVYLASGENFPDALAAAPIAGMNRAPVLLTPKDSVPDKVLAEIARLAPNRVVVVGGEGAVSAAAFAQVPGAVRVSGADRYATARAIIQDGMITNPDFAVTDANLKVIADAIAGLVANAYAVSLQGTDLYQQPLDRDGHGTKAAKAYTSMQKQAIANVRANAATDAMKLLQAKILRLRTAENMKASQAEFKKLLIGAVATPLTFDPTGNGIDKSDVKDAANGLLLTGPSMRTRAPMGFATNSATMSALLTPEQAKGTGISGTVGPEGVPAFLGEAQLSWDATYLGDGTAPFDHGWRYTKNGNPLMAPYSAGIASGDGASPWGLATPWCTVAEDGTLAPKPGTPATVKKPCAPIQSVIKTANDALWQFFSPKEKRALDVLRTEDHEALSFYFATGTNFPDALAIGAIAGNWYGGQPGPVFLEYGTASSVSDENRRLMNDLAATYSVNFRETPGLPQGEEGTFRTFVIGGTGVMSDAMQASISSVKYSEIQGAGDYLNNQNIVSGAKADRIGGADRYETSQLIVSTLKKAYETNEARQGVLATGENFPDALAGSAYAAASNSTLWVTPGTCVTPGIQPMATSLKISQFALLGGVGALAEPVDSLSTCQ